MGVAVDVGVSVILNVGVNVGVTVNSGVAVLAAAVCVMPAKMVSAAAVCTAPISTGMAVGATAPPEQEVRSSRKKMVQMQVFVFIAHLFFRMSRIIWTCLNLLYTVCRAYNK